MSSIFRYSLLVCWSFCLLACQSSEPSEDAPAGSPVAEAPVETEASPKPEAPPAEEAAEEAVSDNPYDHIPPVKDRATLAALKDAQALALKEETAFFGHPELVSKLEALGEDLDEEGFPLPERLDDETFASLGVKGLIYYYIAWQEDWDQICAEILTTAGVTQAIVPNMPFSDGGNFQSSRQLDRLTESADSVAYYYLQYLPEQINISTEALRLVLDLNLKSVVPELVRMYRVQNLKNDVILSTLLEMMWVNKFPVWQESEVYHEMRNAPYRTLDLNEANVDKVLYYAERFAEAEG